jgi:hypothetical protein
MNDRGLVGPVGAWTNCPIFLTISPQGAVDAGAKWRRAGTDTWQIIGVTEPGIPVGQHRVEFSDVSGWTKLGNQSMTINKGQAATIVGNFYIHTVSLPFLDDFSTDKGWSGYEPDGWERGPAVAGSGENGNPDPVTDYSASSDNYILGFAIGGDSPNDLTEESIVPPPIDCAGQDSVFLKFWRYVNVQNNNYDQAKIYVSNDGTNWTQLWEKPMFDSTDNHWTQVFFDISSVAANQGSVYIKFTDIFISKNWGQGYCAGDRGANQFS